MSRGSGAEKTSGEIRFRPASEDDYPDICGLLQDREELFFVYPRGTHPFTIAQLKQLAHERRELTVVARGPRVVGFANLYNYEAGKRAFIGNVVVDRSSRGQGLGKRLVAYMLDICFRKHRLTEAHVSVFGHNIPAVTLYSRLGFAPYRTEERMDFEDRRVTLVHMRLGRQNHRAAG